MKKNNIRILLLDIETKPMLSYIWNLFDEQSGLSMLKSDWSILSWSAKWYDIKNKKSYPVIYRDQRNAKNIEDEREILKDLWSLLDEADVVVGHNVDRFDLKRIKARFVIHGMHPPSSYRTIDTLKISKRNFAMTSHKLEYLAKKLGCKNKKLTARKYPGFDLWKECLAGNKEAWKEMERYNKQDVIVLEEVLKKLLPWDNSINFSVFLDPNKPICSCGSESFLKRGFRTTNAGKFQRYRCNKCGKESVSKVNELDTESRKKLRK